VLLGRSTAAPALPPPVPPAAVPAAAPAPGAPVATPAVQRAARDAPVRGRFKDPFRRSGSSTASRGASSAPGVAQTVTPDPAPAGGGATGASAGGATPDPGPSASPSAAPSVPAGPAPAPAPAPRPGPAPGGAGGAGDRYFAGHRVDVAWGPAASPRRRSAIERLTVLEAAGVPEVVFMGIRPDGRTALFLLVADATAAGDGRCRPVPELCQLIEMQGGDTTWLDVRTAEGIRQYELRVDRVAQRTASTAGAAARLRADRSAAGQRVVRSTIRGGRTFVRRYVYSETRGVLAFVTRGLATKPAE